MQQCFDWPFLKASYMKTLPRIGNDWEKINRGRSGAPQVLNNLVGDMEFLDNPSVALYNATIKTNEQLHNSVGCHRHPSDPRCLGC